MGTKKNKGDWFYDYDSADEYRKTYDCELTDVRYVLGEKFDKNKKNVLICIGINPSTALPGCLDPTLKRVQSYAKKNGRYGAWYMLNVYPQRATKPDDIDMDGAYDMELHRRNLAAIKDLLSSIEQADVWCAWGAVIDDAKRTFLSDLLFGNESKNIQGIISLFRGDYHFKAYRATAKGYPQHPLRIEKDFELRSLTEDPGLKALSDRIAGILRQ